jgi:hypothetical protein
VTVFTYTNNGTDVLVCQAIAQFGDGVNDLDGSGGDFEFTMLLGGQVNQPEPQLVTFSSDTQAGMFTHQFPLPVGQSVTFKFKSPNAADSNVWVRVCLYEVGVESIRDELLAIISRLNKTTNVYGPGTGGGTTATGDATGVYPGRC